MATFAPSIRHERSYIHTGIGGRGNYKKSTSPPPSHLNITMHDASTGYRLPPPSRTIFRSGIGGAGNVHRHSPASRPSTANSGRDPIGNHAYFFSSPQSAAAATAAAVAGRRQRITTGIGGFGNVHYVGDLTRNYVPRPMTATTTLHDDDDEGPRFLHLDRASVGAASDVGLLVDCEDHLDGGPAISPRVMAPRRRGRFARLFWG